MSASGLRPVNLRCEYAADPLAIGTGRPRFTWELAGAGRDLVQSAYRVVVTGQDGRRLWDSGRVRSTDQNAEFGGRQLKSRARCEWRVQVWEGSDTEPGPSAAGRFEVGLLRRSDWHAAWIADPETQPRRPSLFRRSFQLVAVPERARVYATARGVYRLELNGHRVGTDLLRPGWTDYRRRLQYQAYDVAPLLRPGENEIVAELANGWYSGRILSLERVYGDHPSVLIQCEISLPDGGAVEIATGPDWEAAWGPIQSTDMLLGEVRDAREEPLAWRPAVVEDHALRSLVPEVAPVRRLLETPPVAVHGGVFDFGQNLVGRLRLELSGRRGSRVRLRHAEVLGQDGGLYTDNLRGAACTDEYVLRGGGLEVFEPEFAWRGFRYAEIAVVEGEAEIQGVTAVVIQSDLPQALEFECSHELVNRLHSNIVWSQRGNFVEVPMDCPQRDERLGWMGDAQAFAPTACMNMDCAAFLGEKWLRAVVDGQDGHGAFEDAAPMVLRSLDLGGRVWPSGAPGWADAGVIVPHVLYAHYGDRRQLHRMYRSMRRYVEYVHRYNPGLLWEQRRGNDYGDWLAIGEETPKEVVASAFFAQSTRLAAAAADALGKSDDARELDELAARIRSAFTAAYVDADGRIRGDTQTGYTLALAFDLLPPDLREAAACQLVRRLEADCRRLRTGFLGVGLLLPVLEKIGRPDLAHQLLVNRDFPSWGYSIDRGATTIWERWDGSTETGFQDPRMNSFNHYSLGSVGAWIYAAIGGLAPDPTRPGFERAIVRPLPSPETGVTWGRARHHSIRGPFACEWRLDGESFEMSVEVPPNASALVYVPGQEPVEVGSGRHLFETAAPMAVRG